MARKAGPKPASFPEAEDALGPQLMRIGNLLALLLVKGEMQPEKIRVLNAAGYANAEIAQLLGITPNAVTVALYQQRKRK